MQKKEYEDIPGTYVMDSRHYRKGYKLNMFCMSLNKEENRRKFSQNEEAYLQQFELTTEQKKAVLNREWLTMLRLGGNIYYTFKIAAYDGLSMQAIGAKMSGTQMTLEDFQQMMLKGGRQPIQTNLRKE